MSAAIDSDYISNSDLRRAGEFYIPIEKPQIGQENHQLDHPGSSEGRQACVQKKS